ncbi:acetyl esterase/lipase [Pseudarthrobacter sp. PvP004]|nr:acetyl esterase/lipase [Pseudarthrobacter sp. PvP004]
MTDPRAFPGGADLSKFPDSLILNAEFDSLRASGDAFAPELRAHHVPVESEYVAGARHGFLNKPGTEAMSTGLDRIAVWLHARGK